MRFEPIAIVGRSCIFPGAHSPEALWQNVLAQRCTITPLPGEPWAAHLRAPDRDEPYAERTWSDAGGYVEGFDPRQDLADLALDPEQLQGLDPVFLWTLHGARQALRPLGHERPSGRVGLVLGNLSFPTPSMVRYAQSVWLDAQGPEFLRGRARELVGLGRPRPENRFMSGLPASFAARALGLGAGALALDAACASSLYAIKVACDWLHDGRADVMVAGAVNAADRLFLHIGFCALSALSRSGQSRPFDQRADGLVPAEGAAFVALKRLGDAEVAGDRILGVVRAVGLSNDGRGRGLLVPSEEGQLRALQRAYTQTEITPRDIAVLECHATGTTVGDSTELRSVARMFEGQTELAIGSIKGNLGHPITAAGMAGLLKLMAAMEADVLPPTRPVEAPLDLLARSGLRLVGRGEAWPADRPRCAGLNAFGFGGNNAHLVLEQWTGRAHCKPVSATPAAKPRPKIAVVGLCARIGEDRSNADFAAELFSPSPATGTRSQVSLPLEGLRFPPHDMQQALPQQWLILEAACEAARGLSLAREHTGVLIGMGTCPEIARYGTRWQLASWAQAWSLALGIPAPEAWLAAAKAAVQPALTAAGVVGSMPNVLANRIDSQLDLAGASMSVSAEELSGVVALELALRALAAGELDAALVGAVDCSSEIVHRSALAELGIHQGLPADAAVVLVLKRAADAERAGERVLALIDPDAHEGARDATRLDLGDQPGATDLIARRGHAHAASGLLQVAAAITALQHGVRPGAEGAPTPWFGPRAAKVAVRGMAGAQASLTLAAGSSAEPLPSRERWRIRVFSGADRSQLIAAVQRGDTDDTGPARLVIAAASADEAAQREREALRYLRHGGPAPEGVALSEVALAGELAFVFTGAAAAYPGMASDLLVRAPDLAQPFWSQVAGSPEALASLQRGFGQPEHPLDQLWASSLVCQAHARLSRQVLGLKPHAVIGYSSGESNALFALDAWRDLGAMILESLSSPIFRSEVAGEFQALARAWAPQGYTGPIGFQAYAVAAGVHEVRKALEGEPRVHLTIVNTAHDCVIGGEPAACARVLARIGHARAVPIRYDLAAHCPELREIEQSWFQLHRRSTWDVPGVRFYWNGSGSARAPRAEVAAEEITRQAVQTLDFPRVIEQAYRDGVRVFLEHGPRALCSGWIDHILGDRPHLALPLDRAGRASIKQVMQTTASLIAAGVKVDRDALLAKLNLPDDAPPQHGERLSAPAHPIEIRLPSLAGDVQCLEPAPALPRALSEPEPAPRAPTTSVHALPALPSLDTQPSDATRVQASTPLARSIQIQAGLQQVHSDFLEQQTRVQQRFLELQTAMLSGRVGGVRSPDPTPMSPPPMPPKPPARDVPSSIAPRAPTAMPATANVVALPVVGPKFSREQLVVHASGPISTLFGATFAPQDGYTRQVRMPQPPLLLADRVTGIRGVAGSMGKGTIWTETDVREDSWYLHAGRMPAGIMIEAGQADLMLISWLGVDLLNRGERVYRLLGCELTYHAELPRPGDTLVYDIHVDGHAQQGDTRLFFFHYDCHVQGKRVLSVRNGQAGFFTDQELCNSAGVLWDVASAAHDTTGPLDPPRVVCTRQRFDAGALRAFAEGRLPECFGPGFEGASSHVATPRIAAQRMLLLERVTHFDPRGGAWGRGYLRAELPISPDAWFFDGHFKNDPCMPGTLMFEGSLQAMALFLTALGYTLERDGYRFEPMPEQRSAMRCRGQVTPTSKLLVYEVFVHAVTDGPVPTLRADLLCTVDGLKAFHAQDVGLRLVPDWPLERWRDQPVPAPTRGRGAPLHLPALGGLHGLVEPKPVASHQDFPFDYASLLACAWGRPSHAFGPAYAPFDGPRRVARLPGPPYHFMSRVTRVEGEMGKLAAGASAEVEYDVPPAVWYFDDNGSETMPFCVLMEAALQPCGWLASYVGSALALPIDLKFRNLDGTATLTGEIRPGARTLTTRTRLTNVSRSGAMIIESFEVECLLDGQSIFQMNTVFGFFPKEAFDNQSGLPVSEAERARIDAPGDFALDLCAEPARYFAEAPRLAGGMLRALDRISAFAPRGGRYGLGWARAEKDVDPGEWFFKAHFFQDPVQPGSLGIEAFCQLLQFSMRELGLAEGVERPRFEPLALGQALTWKYRGQVVPENRKIVTEIEVLELGSDARGRYARADAALWVDGKRIYQAKNLGMRIVSEPAEARDRPATRQPSREPGEEVLDPSVERWLGDHCPTWTLPALPMMSMVDRLAGAAQRHRRGAVTGVSDVRVLRWLPLGAGPVRLRTQVTEQESALEVSLSAFRHARDPALSRFEPVAIGKVHMSGDYAPAAPAWPALSDAVLEPDPYASGALFHGPAFQLLTELRIGAHGASAWLDLDRDGVPPGHLRQGLLDALTHAIPHDALERWSPEIAPGQVAYPYRLPELTLHGPLPTAGCARVEVRFAGFDGDPRFPRLDIQLIVDERTCASLRLVEVLLPKGPIGSAAPGARRAFLRDRAYVPGLGLSTRSDDGTLLTQATLQASDWLPGNVARIYDVPADAALLVQVAIKDHVARLASEHPAYVRVADAGDSATTRGRPLRRYPLHVEREASAVRVRDAGLSGLDLGLVQAFWRRHFQLGPWPAEDLYYGLVEAFIGDVIVTDPRALAAAHGHSALYVANHQVGVESLLFSMLIPPLSGSLTTTLAKAEHHDSWLGRLIRRCFSYPGVTDPDIITFFDRADQAALPQVLAQVAADMRRGKSALIHVEGTRALCAGPPVAKISSAVLELAESVACPVVPVRFAGALPREPLAQRLEFPVGYTRQDIWVGAPIAPDTLRALPLKARKQHVVDAINALGPSLAEERPGAPNPELSARVRAFMAQSGAAEEQAVLVEVMRSRTTELSEPTRRLLEAARTGELRLADTHEDAWLGELALALFGPQGLRVRME